MVETISIGIALLSLFISIILLVVWILTLIHQAKRGKWVWFVLTLIFPIVLIIYWIVRICCKK